MGIVPDPDFRRLFESAPGLCLVLLPDFRIVAATDAYLEATMTTRDAILGRGIFDVFPDNPDDPEATGVRNLRDSLSRVVEFGRADSMAVQKYDVRRPESDGGEFEERFWSPRNSPVFGQDGLLVYIIHRVEDVTEFVRLRQRGIEQSVFAESLRTKADLMQAEILERAQEIQGVNARLRELQADLERRVEMRTAELTRSNEELQFQIIERERAELALQQSEDQLRQAQKLEAIGRLAAGVAHDFNNLLTVVLTYCGLMLTRLDGDSPLRPSIEQIRAAGIRAADLTRQLLAFSRQQVLEVKRLDLNEILEGLSKMIPRLLGEDVELRMLLVDQPCLVAADRSQVEQVIMNLVVNSRDAMARGGRLTIETARVDLSEDYARGHLGVAPGPYIKLAISDTGIGMEPAVQSRVFEPFFTTKERERGTGLGLSTVFGIVKQTGGSIWLYSEPGVGTTFKLYFPRAEGEVELAPSRAAEMPLARGSETILLVEDLDEVRHAAASVLREYGYEVLTAGSPGEALRLVERTEVTFDLLVTDVVMPKMNGRRLAEEVARFRPGIKVLYMSGYTDDVIIDQGVLTPGTAFLQKPLTPESLTRKVRDLLDSRSRD